MAYFQRCSGCKKRKFYTAQRKYKLRKIGVVTSDGKLCGTCYRAIKKGIKHQLI